MMVGVWVWEMEMVGMGVWASGWVGVEVWVEARKANWERELGDDDNNSGDDDNNSARGELLEEDRVRDVCMWVGGWVGGWVIHTLIASLIIPPRAIALGFLQV